MHIMQPVHVHSLLSIGLHVRERDLLMERLRNLEDEGKAVKDSLVQLVTEKAATNKALTLENQRLRQKVLSHDGHMTVT